MSTKAKTLADIRPGDYVAYYASDKAMPRKRKVTSTGGGIMLEDTGRNPEFHTQTGRRKNYAATAASHIAVITPAIEAYWKYQENLAELQKVVLRASPEVVEAMLKSYPMQFEHLVQINNNDRMQLREWMASPNGSHRIGRVNFEAVVGGGLMIRTDPYDYAVEMAARAERRGKR